MTSSSTILRRRSAAADAPTDHIELIEPMLAVSDVIPKRLDQYSFEWKWDGVRAIAYCNGDHLTLRSRNQIDITHRYPELHALGTSNSNRDLVLDGEIVALDSAGRSSFKLLQERMHVVNPTADLARRVPAVFIIFDLLRLNGHSLLKTPFAERRRMLESLKLVGESWQVTTSHVGQGPAMLKAARENGLEGIVAKRLDGVYEPGGRSPAWLKIKIIQRQEFVVAGWIPERSGDGHRIGSILLGYYEDGKLRYAGRVGTGFNDSVHMTLTRQFTGLTRKKNPFAQAVPEAGVIFLSPTLVVEIEYRRWPDGGLVQQGAFKGVRFDKLARNVVKERVTGSKETR